MNIVILDDYQDAVRKLACAEKLAAYSAKVYTNTVKGIGQLTVRLKDAEAIVLIRERTHLTRQVIEKLLKLNSSCRPAGLAVTWTLQLALNKELPSRRASVPLLRLPS